MRKIGFHASHEIYSPKELLSLVEHAARSGFNAASCPDHFNPWSQDGQSGFAWSWLGAALERTNLEFGTVCAPGQRYHPAIIAQAAATLSQMYPGRFWLALGTGQNVNEHITGDPWPSKAQRQQRLLECVDIIRRLWSGETVTHCGLVNVHEAKLYTLPEKPPLIFGAAITDETAQWVGGWADGLLTVSKPKDGLAKTIEAFRRGGGTNKPMRLQSALSFEPSDRAAEIAAYHNWGIGTLQVNELQDIASPEEFDRLVAKHTPSEIADTLRVSDDLQEHLNWIQDDLDLGFEAVYLHFVGKNIRRFIDDFSTNVISRLR
jgi:probable non-F420 flavinoid oxidoreductase